MTERGETRRVEGVVWREDGAPATGLRLRAYSRGLRGEDELLAEGRTGDDGAYALEYDAAPPVNLELRAVAGREREVSLSTPKFGAEAEERLNLVAPAGLGDLDPEFDRLVAALEPHGGLDALAGADEREGREDLSVLHQATGWDARLLALGAAAVALAEETGLTAEVVYALLRVGLPADAERLALLDAATVGDALRRAAGAAVVGMTAKQIAAALEAFGELADGALLSAPPPGGVSTPQELLAVSGLTKAQQATWRSVWLEHGDGDGLWDAAREAGLPEDKVRRLRVQGKLAHLTGSNAPLVQQLQKVVRDPDGLTSLVDAGLYRPEAWKKLIRDGRRKTSELAAALPPPANGEPVTERLDAYAEELARRVRLEFPTHVVGDLLETGTARLRGRDGKRVGARLKSAADAGLELGSVPVSRFLADDANRRAVFSGRVREDEVEQTVAAMKAVQRVYQLTPSDDAMVVLLDNGLESAYDVARLEEEEVEAKFIEHKRGTREEAKEVHRKAGQVKTTVFGFFTGVQQLAATTGTHGGGSQDDVAAAQQAVLAAHPTLQELFGSLDFCECDHCRSVLSPAAYLVDLLKFLDPDPDDWTYFKGRWSASHANTAYPYKTPYEELTARRPDLAYLELTCENTLTALPYIDVVNEILEWHVAYPTVVPTGAHNTGAAESADLLAEPRNVVAAAYEKLAAARYPVSAPFDLWIETARGFLDQAGAPLAELLDTFRAGDELLPPTGAPAGAVYRAAVFAEQLRISPAEWKLLTDSASASAWYELYGHTDAAAARTALRSAKALSEALGVTYRELVEVVKTWFVNPRLAGVAALNDMGIEASEVFRYERRTGFAELTAAERTAYEGRLAAYTAAHPGFDAAQWVHATYQAGAFDDVVLLADPDQGGCDFSRTYLQYADRDAADDIVYLRINLLVRLWRRLGWPLEDVDRALRAFLPGDSLPLTVANIGPALRSALVSMAHLDELSRRLPAGRDARQRLLALWGPIPTTGPRSLYSRLFLTPTADKVFADPAGRYLPATTSVKLADHLGAVQGALTLTSDDVDRILPVAGLSRATAKLTLDTVSLLYRHGLLARALKLSVRELIALKELSGVDPFAPPPSTPLATIADDRPFSNTLRFVELVESVRATPFDVEELEYLLRHRADAVSPLRPDPASLLALVRTLRAEIARIETEHGDPEDAGTVDAETLRQKLALVLPPATVDELMAMWDGTIEYEAEVANVAAGAALDPADFEGEPLVVAHDPVRQTQRLRYRGVMLAADRARIKAASAAPYLDGLLAEIEGRATGFFDRHLGEFLEPGDFELLFAPFAANLTQQARQNRLRQQRQALVAGFYPFLRERLIRAAVVAAVSTGTDAAPSLVDALVADAALLEDPTTAGAPLRDALVAAADSGVSVKWLTSTDATTGGGAATTRAEVDTSTKPASAQSGRLEGHLEVPASGTYLIEVTLDSAGAEAELRFAHLPQPYRHVAASAGAKLSVSVPLDAERLYGFELTLRNLGTGGAAAHVQGTAFPRSPLSALTLYPARSVDRATRARVLLGKVLTLAGGLGLGEAELRHLTANATSFGGFDPSDLPTRAQDDSAQGAVARFAWFARVAGYARLKADLAAEGDQLVDLFARARRTFPATADETQSKAAVMAALSARIGELTRREPAVVERTAQALGIVATSSTIGGSRVVEVAKLADERGLRRLWDALRTVAALRVPPDAVVGWTGIVTAAAAARPAIATGIRDALRSRYDDEAWRRVAQPVFDRLRQRKRDALVSHLVHVGPFETEADLYEEYLVDPGMEPVVQTSRIQLAIASVQLFVQRALLSLEDRVPPGAIARDRWEWMRRYRVWEANRKIFLYPENWLEPEFRDSKSGLFEELESALLEGDVSADRAEDAFLAYLRGLEAISRLEVVSTYAEEHPTDPGGGVLHVVARTYGVPSKYYYRRLEAGLWSPWEAVTAEIDGDHVVAAVWRGRLHLFWATFAERGRAKGTATSVRLLADEAAAATIQSEVEVRLSWSERLEGKWSTRTTASTTTVIREDVDAGFDPADVLITVRKEQAGGAEGAIRIELHDPIGKAFRLAGRNSAPTVVDGSEAAHMPYIDHAPAASLYAGAGALTVRYVPHRETRPDRKKQEEAKEADGPILAEARAHTLAFPDAPLLAPEVEVAPWTAPFFYQDAEHAFYVEPELRRGRAIDHEPWVRPSKERREEAPPELPDIPVKVFVPEVPEVPEPAGGRPEPPGGWPPYARYEVRPEQDWAVAPQTVIRYGDAYVAREGGVDREQFEAAQKRQLAQAPEGRGPWLAGSRG